MKIKTNELTGAALDWAVAECEGITSGKDFAWFYDRRAAYQFSTDWAQGGPIIEREGIAISAHLDKEEWVANDYWNDNEYTQVGPTPLIAAMRCYVASQLGDEVETPEALQTA